MAIVHSFRLGGRPFVRVGSESVDARERIASGGEIRGDMRRVPWGRGAELARGLAQHRIVY